MGKVTFSHLCILVTRMVHKKISSDLDMGRRPKLKSDEFFVCDPFYYPHSHPSKNLPYQKMRHLIGAGPLCAHMVGFDIRTRTHSIALSPESAIHGWGVSEIIRILGANARNSVNTAKFLSPAKPAKSPLGRGKTAKFSPARYWLYRMPHIRTVRARHIAPD